MSKLNLTLACWSYDRTDALRNGEIEPEGINLNFLPLAVEETFFRMLRHAEFDVSEMSLSSYCMTLHQDEHPFVAIPVFPSRFFRHSCVFVSTRCAVTSPADLAGKRIGVPEYQMTAPVWIRGILQEDFGLDPRSMNYLVGGEEQPGREEKIPLQLPEGFSVTPIGPGETLAQMLADGDIDALLTARTPSTFYSRPGDVGRLFADHVEVEQDYFSRTNIFPIMHVVAIRREVYERNRWLAQSLLKAFTKAKALAVEQLINTASLKTMLPWQTAAVEKAVALMGEDWWPYGVEPNRHVLETFLRFHHEQGLSPRRLTVDELFAAETYAAFRI